MIVVIIVWESRQVCAEFECETRRVVGGGTYFYFCDIIPRDTRNLISGDGGAGNTAAAREKWRQSSARDSNNNNNMHVFIRPRIVVSRES